MKISTIEVIFLTFISFFVVFFCGLVTKAPVLHSQNIVVFGILTFTMVSYSRALYVIYNN